jgi:hypothetical protein
VLQVRTTQQCRHLEALSYITISYLTSYTVFNNSTPHHAAATPQQLEDSKQKVLKIADAKKADLEKALKKEIKGVKKEVVKAIEKGSKKEKENPKGK